MNVSIKIFFMFLAMPLLYLISYILGKKIIVGVNHRRARFFANKKKGWHTTFGQIQYQAFLLKSRGRRVIKKYSCLLAKSVEQLQLII